MSNKQQYVQIIEKNRWYIVKTYLNPLEETRWGVLHGSILDSILFIIYVNDIIET